MAVQGVHQGGEVGVLAVGLNAEVAEDGRAEFPAGFAGQAAEGELVAQRSRQPRFLAAAGDQDLAPPALDRLEEAAQELKVVGPEQRIDAGGLVARGGFEVVPDEEQAVLAQGLAEGRELLVRTQRDVLAAKDLRADAVEDVLGGVDVVEGEPEAPGAKTFRLPEPLEKAACERGLADAAQAMDENRGRVAEQGPFQGQDGAVAADEAVGILFVRRLLGQGRSGLLSCSGLACAMKDRSAGCCW